MTQKEYVWDLKQPAIVFYTPYNYNVTTHQHQLNNLDIPSTVGESFSGGLVLRSQEASGGLVLRSQEASGGLVLWLQEALATGTYVTRGLRRSCFTVARGSYTV